MKFTEFWDQVHANESKAFEGKPHGRLQWKGTDACIDLHCVCGSHGHLDEEFLYHYKCLFCGRRYALGSHVPLIELTDEQANFIENGGGCAFRSDPDVLSDDPVTGGAPEVSASESTK